MQIDPKMQLLEAILATDDYQAMDPQEAAMALQRSPAELVAASIATPVEVAKPDETISWAAANDVDASELNIRRIRAGQVLVGESWTNPGEPIPGGKG
jgi:hypothetical protein